jgi:cbb3-type cytochrome oxidase cytochrome c subunit
LPGQCVRRSAWGRRGPWALAVGIAAWLCGAAPALAQDDDELPEYRPGLVAEYQAADGRAARRVEGEVAAAWGAAGPDARLGPGPVAATWRGRLFTIAPGAYRLHLFADGPARVRLAGQEVLAGTANGGWLDGRPVELEYGYHPLQIEYQGGEAGGRIGLYWSGPQFQLEPLPERHLFHDPADSPDGRFQAGQTLARALRCGVCHALPGEARDDSGATGLVGPIAAPALTRLRGNIEQAWLVDWLADDDPLSADQAAPKSTGRTPAAPGAMNGAFGITRKMPHLGLTADEARLIAAYLASAEPPHDAAKVEAGRVTDGAGPIVAEQPGPIVAEQPGEPEGDSTAGARLLRTVGCLACHRAGGLGAAGLFGGGDLTAIARKRPADFFARWLTRPEELNPDHRMPVFALTGQETADLAAYLATLRGDADADDAGDQANTTADSNEPRGRHPGLSAIEQQDARRLLTERRCAACHALPRVAETAEEVGQASAPLPPVGIAATRIADWDATCLGEPDGTKRRPGYRLPDEAREALRVYLTEGAPKLAAAERDDDPTLVASAKDDAPARPASATGAFVLAERNCTACHARGQAVGIAAVLPAVIEADPELAPLLPALAPPALLSVGDKLHDEALAAAIAARGPPLRPWLGARMPRFNLNDDERRALVAHLVAADRIPDRGPAPDPAADDPTALPRRATPTADALALEVAGRRLVTADGFGCTSCHQIGQSVPQKVALNAQGTDLSEVGRRIRQPWFDRWVRNPARIVPRMEMPSVQTPVRGVLHERLADQLAAVWTVLNQPGFDPPPPNPIRVVRATGLADDRSPPNVLTDVLHAGQRVLIAPLVIGLPNRHNVLVDLETNRLAGWWLGDTARQRTVGKSWHWEPGGVDVWPLVDGLGVEGPGGDGPGGDGPGELALLVDGVPRAPVAQGQFIAQLAQVETRENGARFDQRLSFDDPRSTVFVRQTFAGEWPPPDDGIPSGDRWTRFRRRLEIGGLAAGQQVQWRIAPGGALTLNEEGRRIEPATEHPLWRIRVRQGPDPRLSADGRSATITLTIPFTLDGPVCDLEYETRLPLDQYIVPPPAAESIVAAELDVVPGWRATRLPLSSAIMPTGLAWRDDRVLAFTSLKGQVHLARDTDGDGLEDALSTFADGLAAPYGLVANGNALDVIHKPALVRLHDADGDGHAERVETLAAGWGHTADYHDWAVGLPRDAAGNYYVALPCQQDDRTPAAAHLRGTVLKLSPREPTSDDRWPYSIETLSAGLRFPMGLALRRDGALLATDNQGNYNPFNELNHLLPGARYGFINKLEFRPGFDPPSRPAAVEIPHPLTRSVNGICFLDTPANLRADTGRDAFGPFEGHLIGCEYDTRALVRISLDTVTTASGQTTLQGAVYPFSVPPAEGAEPLEGPVVCAVAPDGDLVVGNLRDSGWGAGNNTGSIVRLRPEAWPLGIAQVRATPDGFTIDFTGPVDRRAAERTTSYAVESFRRIATPAYGGPDVDRRAEPVRAVELSADGLQAQLRLDEPRPGFVYELRLKPLGPAGEALHPAEAYYTLRVVPGS